MDDALRGIFGGLVCSVHTGQPHGARSQSAYRVRTTPRVHASPYCAQARSSLHCWYFVRSISLYCDKTVQAKR